MATKTKSVTTKNAEFKSAALNALKAPEVKFMNDIVYGKDKTSADVIKSSNPLKKYWNLANDAMGFIYPCSSGVTFVPNYDDDSLSVEGVFIPLDISDLALKYKNIVRDEDVMDISAREFLNVDKYFRDAGFSIDINFITHPGWVTVNIIDTEVHDIHESFLGEHVILVWRI